MGAGSVFWLDLDLPEVLESTEVARAKEGHIIGFKGENRSFLVNLLEPLGFEIVEAIDGFDCLNKAFEFKIVENAIEGILSYLSQLQIG